MVERSAEELIKNSKDLAWQKVRSERYEELGKDFRRDLDGLIKATRAKNNEGMRANVSLNTSVRSTLCGTNRAGITPSPPTVPRASAHSTRPTNACHGIGEFSLMEKVTSCSTSVTSLPLVVFPLASSSSAAGSTNLRAQQTRIRISRA